MCASQIRVQVVVGTVGKEAGERVEGEFCNVPSGCGVRSGLGEAWRRSRHDAVA